MHLSEDHGGSSSNSALCVGSNKLLFPAWEKALSEVSAATDRICFLIRVANHTNQRALARALAQVLRDSQKSVLDITIIGKPEGGAAQMAQHVCATLNRAESSDGPLRLRCTILEAADYGELEPETLKSARDGAAILFVVSALAPFFDETVEVITRRFGSNPDKVIVVIATDEDYLDLEITVADLVDAAAHQSNLQGFKICAESDMIPCLTEMLAIHVRATLQQLGSETRLSRERLLPIVNTFGEFLSISQAQYLRRIEFIHRDLSGLTVAAERAQELLITQSQAALSHAIAPVSALSQTMQRQAETTARNVTLSRETLANQAERTRFGRDIIGTARRVGYQEFDACVQSLAMGLNSARSVLISSIDELRWEARAHLEELVLNLGADLFSAWFPSGSFSANESFLDFSLDTGVDFPKEIIAAAAEIRQAIPEIEFSSGWPNRIEAMFKNELASAACAGWTSTSIDGRLANAVTRIWENTTSRPCGILIGRLNEITRVVSAEMQSSRLGSLQLPADQMNRTKVAKAYRAFSRKLTEIQVDTF
jgi:hypothetical protein